MDFSKALEAMKAGKKVRSPFMRPGDYITFQLSLGSGKPIYKEPQYFKKGVAPWTYYKFTCQEMESNGWEIFTDAPEVTSYEVLSEFKTWLEKAIMSSCGTPGNGHPYLIQCLDKLDELSASKPTRVRTPEKCTVLIVSNNKAVVKTESGNYDVIQLQ